MQSKVIIYAGLCEPPSEPMAFRDITFLAYKEKADVLIEIEKEAKDFYYHFMRRLGLLDFVEEIIEPEEHESGIRIYPFENYKEKTIIVDRITVNNELKIAGKIRSYLLFG